jgi:hypothetical protein
MGTETYRWQEMLTEVRDGVSLVEVMKVLEVGLGRKLPEVTVIGRLRRFGFVQIDGKWYRKASLIYRFRSRDPLASKQTPISLGRTKNQKRKSL